MSLSRKSTPELSIARTPRGEEYAKVGALYLHSAYEPAREAERFLSSEVSSETPSTVIVVGEALGYLTRAVASRFPLARIVVIYFHDAFHRGAQRPDSWHPGAGCGIEEFLDRSLDELDLRGLKVLRWAPSARAFPELSGRVDVALAQLLRERGGSLATASAFGARWIANALANRLSIPSYCPLGALRRLAAGRPIVIAASGPSLLLATALLRENREGAWILALASSVPALLAADIVPDLVVTTDPGFWASSHLAELRRAPGGIPLAMPLSAARGAWGLKAPVLALRHETFFESDILSAAPDRAIVAYPLPQTGTVAATAIDLALALSDGPLVFAGLDLAYEDILDHARPHAFDPLWRDRTGRLDPEYGRLFCRAVEGSNRLPSRPGSERPRQPFALRTYAGWIERRARSLAGRLYRLNPSAVDLPGIPGIEGAELGRLLRGSGLRRVAEPLRAEPASIGRETERKLDALLGSWRRELAAERDAVARGAPRPYLDLAPGSGSRLGELLYYLDTRGLAETRGRLRSEGIDGAREAYLRALARSEEAVERLSGAFSR